MSPLFWLVTVLAFVVGLVCLLPWFAERLRRPMDVEEARIKAPGAFAELPSGVTHYRWFGPQDGPVVVCVHGLSTPSFAFTGLATALAMKGFRVLTYDLYGRGFSDNVPGDQNVDFFLRQLDELLDHLGVAGKFSIIGYSMGGMIVTAYAARHPQRLERVMLLAAAGVAMPKTGSGGLARLQSFPAVARWLGVVFGGLSLRKYIRAEQGADTVRDRQLEQTRRRGYWPALMSSQQHMLATDYEALHRQLAQANVPVIAVWARKDQVIPISAVGILAKWNRGARQEVLEDANHGLPYSHPRQIADIFLSNL